MGTLYHQKSPHRPRFDELSAPSPKCKLWWSDLDFYDKAAFIGSPLKCYKLVGGWAIWCKTNQTQTRARWVAWLAKNVIQFREVSVRTEWKYKEEEKKKKSRQRSIALVPQLMASACLWLVFRLICTMVYLFWFFLFFRLLPIYK